MKEKVDVSSSALTQEELRRAWKILGEASEEDRKFKESRTLKDRSKLQPFYDVIKGKGMTDELLQFCNVIEHLAMGFILVLPNSLKAITDKQLKEEYKLPQEILDNLITSTYLPVVSDERSEESSAPNN